MRGTPKVLAVSSIVLAGTAGFLTATTFAQGNAAPAEKTVTVNIGTGSTGPAGPPGPAGPAGPKGDPGSLDCPTGFVIGEVIVNHSGGKVTIYGCIKEG